MGWNAGVRFPAGVRIFSSSYRQDEPWGPTKPAIQWVPEAIFPGIKRPGREVNQSPPSSVEVMNDEVISPIPHAFMV
jgi:hypothetical protein